MGKGDVKKIFENKELRELDKLVDAFAEAMKSKLISAFYVEPPHDYCWRNPENKNKLLARLIANASDGDMVDAANYAAFLWGIDKEAKDGE
uniref:Uncharacterized protein n=1 Tax=viral metagenome TaxID=1070528 RepID=A0A6M3LW02_9ZZZZ